MKAKVTKEGLLIPREMAERLGSEEVEITEEPGRLLISPVSDGDEGWTKAEDAKDPILSLGRNPVRTRVRDGSTNHDRYLYTRD